MVCSICNGAGHNRRTCPHRNTTGLVNQGIQINRPVPPRNPPNRLTIEAGRALTRKFWKTTIKTIINLQRFVKVSFLLYNDDNRKSGTQWGDHKYAYFHWLKIKEVLNNFEDISTLMVGGHNSPSDILIEIYESLNMDDILYEDQTGLTHITHRICNIKNILGIAHQTCIKFHKVKNPVKDNKRKIKLINMKNENYLIYWVVGNLMIEDIDSRENPINFMGMLRKNDTFKLSTINGHRFYLVPHKLDFEPPYHPQTDKQFFIDPYLQLNIHEGSSKEIHIDEGEKLSELNRWKFNALKLDYLIRELIKLGAKNNENLDVVLDLHEDIVLDTVSEWYKDIAGVPSTFTNIT